MSKFKVGDKVKYIKTSGINGARLFSVHNDKIGTIVEHLGDFYKIRVETFGKSTSDLISNVESIYPIDNIKIDESKLNDFLS